MAIPRRAIIHHSAIPALSLRSQLRDIDAYHKSLDFPKSSLGYFVGYHFLIEPSGQVIQTRKDDEMGAHTKGWNEDSLGICLSGDFDQHSPTFEQTNALRNLLNEKCQKYSILPVNVSGHKNFRLTSCPGKLLPDTAIRGLIMVSISQLQLMISLIQAQIRLLMLKGRLGSVVEKEDLV